MVAPTLTAEAEPSVIVDELAIFRKLQSRPKPSSLWRVAGPVAIVVALAAGGLGYYESQHANPAAPALTPSSPPSPAPLAQEVSPPQPIIRPPPAPVIQPAPAAVARMTPTPRVIRAGRAVAHSSARSTRGAGEDANAYAPAASAPAPGSSAAPAIAPPTVQAPPSNPPPLATPAAP